MLVFPFVDVLISIVVCVFFLDGLYYVLMSHVTQSVYVYIKVLHILF